MKYLFLIPIFFSVQLLSAQEVALSFRVDMRQLAVSPKGVHVAGSFQSEAGHGSDWDPAATPLTDPDGDQIYEATVNVPAGLYHYKFINGNSWSEQPEQLSATCATDDGGGNFNREVSVGASDLRLPVVPFNACNTQLILSVNMAGETVSPAGVHVAGNFQALAGYGSDWNPAATPLTDPDGDGIYSIRLDLPTGGLYQYKFINGNSWESAELVPAACGTDDGNGNLNRTVDATATSTSTPFFCFSACDTCGSSSTPPPSQNYTTHWWNDAVFYEIFVRSFYDSNGDGTGDFRGLIQKLDYLNDGDPATTTDLGITGIWLMPMMESPSYHGYDVTDYYAVEPDYGTMADFEAFLAAAHARGIKVIIDFVTNHTSSQHPWFTQSASSTSNAYRDWYLWSDTNPGFSGPWGQDVWHLRNNDYYYGLFWGGMPDLNWSNPEVQAEMWDITRFWLQKGVDGYRLDAIKYLDENGTVLENTPETFALLEEFNQVYKSANPDALAVGEVWSSTSSVVPYVQNNRLDLAFEFDLAYSIISGIKTGNPNLVSNQLAIIDRAYAPLQYATFLTNHDQDRVLNEFGGDLEQMKQAASLYLTMPGVPFLYYGEEVGLLGSKPDEDIRRPMQWTPGRNAGFTTGTPWHSLNSNYAQFNVQTMESDPASLLNHYKRLIHLRNDYAPLRRGYHLPVAASSADILSYARVYEDEAVIVVSNFGNTALTNPSFSLAMSTLPAGSYAVKELYSSQTLGTVTVTAEGGISNWSPEAGVLAPAETWLLSLAPTTDTGPTGLVTAEQQLPVRVYPNPTTGLVNIQLVDQAGAATQLALYDFSGRLVHKASFSGNHHTLQTEQWAAGTYFLKIVSGTAASMQRVVIGE